MKLETLSTGRKTISIEFSYVQNNFFYKQFFYSLQKEDHFLKNPGRFGIEINEKTAM
jgi:hypothetical protein